MACLGSGLVTTTMVTSPFLFGVIRPRIVVPEETLGSLGESELRAMLAHELVHFKRRDTWIGWLQVIAQSIFLVPPVSVVGQSPAPTRARMRLRRGRATVGTDHARALLRIAGSRVDCRAWPCAGRRKPGGSV